MVVSFAFSVILYIQNSFIEANLLSFQYTHVYKSADGTELTFDDFLNSAVQRKILRQNYCLPQYSFQSQKGELCVMQNNILLQRQQKKSTVPKAQCKMKYITKTIPALPRQLHVFRYI